MSGEYYVNCERTFGDTRNGLILTAHVSSQDLTAVCGIISAVLSMDAGVPYRVSIGRMPKATPVKDPLKEIPLQFNWDKHE